MQPRRCSYQLMAKMALASATSTSTRCWSYRVTRNAVVVARWYRQRQNLPR